MRTVIFLSVLVISLMSMAFLNERAHATEDFLCELQLTSHNLDSAQQVLKTHFFNRLFTLLFAHEMREKALRKLNLPEDITTEELDNLVLVGSLRTEASAEDPMVIRFFTWSEIQHGNMATLSFPMAEPFMWKPLRAISGISDLSASWAIELMPKQKVGLHYDHRSSIGYLSDPDFEGVRRFLSVRGENDLYVDVTIGLDVPCHMVGDYTYETTADLEHVLTTGIEYCRIPVLSFSRVERLHF